MCGLFQQFCAHKTVPFNDIDVDKLLSRYPATTAANKSLLVLKPSAIQRRGVLTWRCIVNHKPRCPCLVTPEVDVKESLEALLQDRAWRHDALLVVHGCFTFWTTRSCEILFHIVFHGRI